MNRRHPIGRAALLGGGLFLLVSVGCKAGNSSGTPLEQSTAAVSAPPTAPASAFNADRAFTDLKKQCAFGPRVPNTDGHRQTRDWLLEQLKQSTDRAMLQDYTRTFNGKRLAMSNIVAEINPDAKKKVMLCAHWDTRPTADQEIDSVKRRQPITGANDGASGVAVLLELARNFKEKRPEIGVQIVLFDGEDYGPGLDRMFLGAVQYARSPALPKADYAILIDMIGDKDQQIYRERNSQNNASEINDKVWKAARDLGITSFKDQLNYDISDDHIPLQQAGWKAIDLIDFDYAAWHTLDDTVDKCSPASLKAVGDVLARVVYTETNTP